MTPPAPRPRPRPEEPFETGRLFTPRVDRYSQIAVRTNRYPVPVRLIGKRVRVMLHASHLMAYDRNVEAARHERLIAKGGCRLELDHCLEALIRKPGAFPGATALEQASPARCAPGSPRRSSSKPRHTSRGPGGGSVDPVRARARCCRLLLPSPPVTFLFHLLATEPAITGCRS
ncbi:hypothetical protein ACFZA1_41660 [Streptomyces filipinensis]|uniref:Mu transposase domain-containing protein n=1 Tax=Streptomyces filipinensis TaxID=66887 RepID=UPI0036E45665